MDYAIKTILYATDLGPHGPEIFNHAFGIAKQSGAKIYVVHVVEPVSDYAHSLLENYVPADRLEALRQEGFDKALQEIHQRLEAFCRDKLHSDATQVVADTRVVEGIPSAVILSEAERINADLIVLGSHGHSALGELVMGSVAHKITMKSKVPVLLVPIKRQ